MPSIWDIVGETITETAVGPLIIGGAIVSVVAVPEVRRRLRQWSVQGAAAAIATADVVAKQMRSTGGGTQGILEQLGRRVQRAAAEVREEWDDFVAEVQAAREQRAQRTEEPQASQSAGEEPEAGSEDGPEDLGTAAPRPRHRPHRTRRSGQARGESA